MLKNHSSRQIISKDYFNKNAKNWQKNVTSLKNKINTQKIRNKVVIDFYKKNKTKIKSALDVGCGSGELINNIASSKLYGVGLDYAEKMIKLAIQESKKIKKEKFTNFHADSILDYKPNFKFDMISGLGFIEYFERNEITKVIKFFDKYLNNNGWLILGSRNRLFNLFSLNDFTLSEKSSPVVAKLLLESTFLNNSKNLSDFLNKSTEIFKKNKLLSKYPKTKIKVAGYQYTPLEIVEMFSDTSFKIKYLCPVNYHSSTPNLQQNIYNEFLKTSSFITKNNLFDHRFIPYCSTFVAIFQKKI